MGEPRTAPNTQERRKLVDRYLNDAPFHHLVDRVAHQAAWLADADGGDAYKQALATAKEAILLWLEQDAHNAAIQGFIDSAPDRRAFGLGSHRGNVVGGRVMERSLADFTRSCEVHILEEQQRPNPDNALVALLADAVRLAREHTDTTRRPAGWCS